MDSLPGLLQSAFKPSKQLNELFSGASSQPFMPAFTGKASVEEKTLAQSSALLLDIVLGKIPGTAPAVQQTSVSDFSPQAVADRITGFIDTSVQRRAGSEIEIQSMLQQAKEGIEQGINEARDILESSGELSAEVEQQLNETESLVFQGLDKLERTLIQPPAQATDSTGVSESGQVSSQFQQTRKAAIEIVTRDGDRVAVSYSAFTQSASSQQFSLDDSAFSFSSRQQTRSAVAFQFSVEGELDAEERDSINDLLKDIGDIAGQFFQGDVQAAFNASLELGFDGDALKSFSLDFQQATRVQVTQAYQRTGQLYSPLDSEAGPAIASPRPAVNLLSQLDDLLAQVKENNAIRQPENTLKSLLVDMLDLLDQVSEIPAPLPPVQSYIREIIDIY
ncbi:MAG TPA: hypothetical protein ENJ08_05120 [Gammaproteobacteria bacterium]|nr:hypothetical protein [Gammaproteobacteria bacterium]